jgi:peptidylprolyl isomerase/FKBP-type peptidyl-prolyl cis-trans isomerase FklB
VNGVVDGFSTALQHMQVGDKWEIWIPWKLGYGESGNNSIQGYTTLVFEIELVAIVE